jgi:hypothetical protein
MLTVVRWNSQVPVSELTVAQIFSGWQQVWPPDGNWQVVSIRWQSKAFPYYYMVNGMKDTGEPTERAYSVRYNGGIQSDCCACLRNCLKVLGIRYSGST